MHKKNIEFYFYATGGTVVPAANVPIMSGILIQSTSISVNYISDLIVGNTWLN